MTEDSRVKNEKIELISTFGGRGGECDQKKKLIHEPWESNARLLLKNMSHQNVCLLAWRPKGLIPPILRPYPPFGFLPLARLSQIPPSNI